MAQAFSPRRVRERNRFVSHTAACRDTRRRASGAVRPIEDGYEKNARRALASQKVPGSGVVLRRRKHVFSQDIGLNRTLEKVILLQINNVRSAHSIERYQKIVRPTLLAPDGRAGH